MALDQHTRPRRQTLDGQDSNLSLREISPKSAEDLRSTALSPDSINGYLASVGRPQQPSAAAFDGRHGTIDFAAAPNIYRREAQLRIGETRIGDTRTDAVPASPESNRNDAEAARSREALLRSAERNIANPRDRERFRGNIAAFEARAAQDKLDPAEVARTYQNIDRLFNAPPDSPVSKWRRRQLAQEVMGQAARPQTIDQGNDNNTCNVTAVENIIYSKQPGAAAKLVADVATTGSYTASDGTKVTLNAQDFKPDAEASRHPRKDGDRSYATQLFNLTAVNLHYQKNEPRLRYEIVPGKGERVMDHSKHPPVETRDEKGKVIDHPNLDDDHIVGVHNMISGKSGGDVYLVHKNAVEGESKLITTFDSPQALADKLREMKAKGDLPVILAVNCAVNPFYKTSGGGSPRNYEGEHVVVVRDIEGDRVAVDNQYGTAGDHLGRKMLSLNELYRGTLTTPEAVTHLEAEIAADRARGVRDPQKAAELVRLRKFVQPK